jgi:hypothetical protein
MRIAQWRYEFSCADRRCAGSRKKCAKSIMDHESRCKFRLLFIAYYLRKVHRCVSIHIGAGIPIFHSSVHFFISLSPFPQLYISVSPLSPSPSPSPSPLPSPSVLQQNKIISKGRSATNIPLGFYQGGY